MTDIILIINVPRIILHFVFDSETLDIIAFYLTIYPTFFSVSNIAIRDEERQMETLEDQREYSTICINRGCLILQKGRMRRKK